MREEKELIDFGKRLKKAREDAKLTQHDLYKKTGISTSQISSFENGHKRIGLYSLSRIALATNTSMDELYLGPECKKPITTSKNDGELIVNCVVALHDIGVLRQNTNLKNRGYYEEPEYPTTISISLFSDILGDLIKKLDDFKANEKNYPDPRSFREQIIASASKQINDFLHAATIRIESKKK